MNKPGIGEPDCDCRTMVPGLNNKTDRCNTTI